MGAGLTAGTVASYKLEVASRAVRGTGLKVQGPGYGELKNFA
jgi:hypothetical protein